MSWFDHEQHLQSSVTSLNALTELDVCGYPCVSLYVFTQASSCSPLVDALSGEGSIGAALVNLLIERGREIEAHSVILKVPSLNMVASLLAYLILFALEAAWCGTVLMSPYQPEVVPIWLLFVWTKTFEISKIMPSCISQPYIPVVPHKAAAEESKKGNL
jgi:hypothetical protein